jgi:hypothetical protein
VVEDPMLLEPWHMDPITTQLHPNQSAELWEELPLRISQSYASLARWLVDQTRPRRRVTPIRSDRTTSSDAAGKWQQAAE